MSFDDLPVFDVEQLVGVLESDDTAVLRSFYELFLKQLNELQQALSSPHQPMVIADLQMLAHKFKSSAKAVGAMRLGQQMEALEAICSQPQPVGVESQIGALRRTVEASRAALHAWLVAHPV
ncbi:MAG: Hpt domain-containing protein [Pseudomonadota bacterium]